MHTGKYPDSYSYICYVQDVHQCMYNDFCNSKSRKISSHTHACQTQMLLDTLVCALHVIG